MTAPKLALVAASLVLSATALAQYPTKPIRMLVPFSGSSLIALFPDWKIIRTSHGGTQELLPRPTATQWLNHYALP